MRKSVVLYNYNTYNLVNKSISNSPVASQIKLDGDLVRSYSYNATTGDVTSVKDYRQFATDGSAYIDQTFTYDDIGRPTKLTYTDHAGSTSTKKEEYTLGYDANSMITSETVYTNYDEEKTVDKTYTYDAIGRLLSAVDGDTQTDYTYDEVGNRLTQKKKEDKTQSGWDEQFTYSYNNLNQLTVIQKTADGKTSTHASYTYDDLGNQIKEVQQHLSVTVDNSTTTYNKTTTYEYDLRNQLSQVEVQTPQVADETTGTVTYTTDVTNNTYNASGQRIVKEENGKTTRYYYMGDNVLYTANEHNVLQTENILDLSGSIVASKRFLQPSEAESEEYANQYYFYHYDVRGSVTNILSPAGTVVKGYDYDEFGQSSKKGDDNFLNEMTFTGSVMDATSGLQYMNARYYQPSTGRFLSQDTYSGNPYDPWTQHLYSYTGNNPINFIDPTGHKADYILAASNFGENRPDYILAASNFGDYTKSDYVLASKNFGNYQRVNQNIDRTQKAFGSKHTDSLRIESTVPEAFGIFKSGFYSDVTINKIGDQNAWLTAFSKDVNGTIDYGLQSSYDSIIKGYKDVNTFTIGPTGIGGALANYDPAGNGSELSIFLYCKDFNYKAQFTHTTYTRVNDSIVNASYVQIEASIWDIALAFLTGKKLPTENVTIPNPIQKPQIAFS